MIETVFNWLAAQPGLQNLQLEALCAAPGSSGLFCKGQEVLWRRQDILGKELRRMRLTFRLCLHRTGTGAPAQLLALTQTAESAAPILGLDQTLSLEQGRMVRSGAGGIARYELRITFEFTSEV